MSINLWKDSYKIGDREIDLQHYELFQKIGHLVDIAKNGDPKLQQKECLDLVDFLINYTMDHFKAEEALQKQMGYVSYEQHAHIHAQFRNTAHDYHKKIHEEYSAEVLQNFVGTLMTWLAMHVCGCDQKIMRNEPLKSNYSSLHAEEIVPEVLKNIFTDMYNINILKSSSCMYKGYVEGKVFVHSVAQIEQKKYALLYGLSDELVKEIYRSVSGLELEDINNMSYLEQSALMELCDIISCNILCADDAAKLTSIRIQNALFTSEKSMEKVVSKESLLLDIQTDHGQMEVLCCEW